MPERETTKRANVGSAALLSNPLELAACHWCPGRLKAGRKREKSPLDLRSHCAPTDTSAPGSIPSHLGILRPEGFDSLGHVAVVDVAAVNFEEIVERCRFISGSFERGC